MILPSIDGYNLSFVYRDYEFEQIAGQNASIFFKYSDQNNTNPTTWVGLEISESKWTLHPWEVCLVQYPMDEWGFSRVTELDRRDIQLVENPPISARYFAYKEKSNNQTEVVLYWYSRSLFKVDQNYIYMWTKTSVIQYASDPNNYLQVEDDILPFAQQIAYHWQPIKEWSVVSLAAAENSIYVIAFSILVGIILLLYVSFINYKSMNRTLSAYNIITSESELNFLTMMKENDSRIKTEELIKEQFIDSTGEYGLDNRLNESIKSNIVERKLKHINDEPYLSFELNYIIKNGYLMKTFNIINGIVKNIGIFSQ
jgi:hypothetical protein